MTKPMQAESHEAEMMRRSAHVAFLPENEIDRDTLNIEVFRYAMARKINTFLDLPQQCREPVCQRSKRCVGPTMRCQRDCPPPQVTREEQSAMLAEFSKILKQYLREQGVEGY